MAVKGNKVRESSPRVDENKYAVQYQQQQQGGIVVHDDHTSTFAASSYTPSDDISTLQDMEEGGGGGTSVMTSSKTKKSRNPLKRIWKGMGFKSHKTKDGAAAGVNEKTSLMNRNDPPSSPVQNAWNDFTTKSGEIILKTKEIQPIKSMLSLSSRSSTDDLSAANNNNNNNHEDKMKRRETFQRQMAANMEFTLTQCLVAIGLYILMAILAFSYVFEDWSIVDSMYFSVVCFTTIGYGDLVPTTKAGQLFTCFFALGGVACLGIALGVVGDKVIEAQEKAVQKAEVLSKKRALSMFSSTKSSVSNKTSLDVSETSRGTTYFDQVNREVQQELASEEQNEKSILEGVSGLVIELFAILVFLFIFGLSIASDPGIDAANNPIRTAYFLIITASTVGFGDLSPKSQQGRLTAVVFIPLVAGAMGHWLSRVAGHIMEQRQSKVRHDMTNRELTLEDIELMDEDDDGVVTRAEFVEFMLVAMNKVDHETIHELREAFKRLDADNSGTLDKDDLVAAARKKKMLF